MNQLFESFTNSSPALKWPGRKTKLLKPIKLAFQSAPCKPEVYIEPFVGSGAVFLMLKNNGLIKKAFLNDYLKELEIFYKTLKNRSNLNNFEIEFKKHLKSYNAKSSIEEKKNFYNKKRETYNTLLLSIENLHKEEKVELSALLLFLNKSCFNGVYRKNNNGQFNVPHGRRAGLSQNLKFDLNDSQHLLNLSKLFNNTKITSGDFNKSLVNVNQNDFVFIDPPYVEKFVDYSEKGFDDSKNIELYQTIKQLKERSVNFLMTNSNTPKTKEIFFNNKFYCYELEVTRTIERRKNDKSGRTTEILVSSYKIDALGESIW
ncbi:Dam family site-specific DNA-(adenine-N6)-methyltransferase [bacterium]|nr:Dam family site-specific DNA-(adenine-N6)-methyltransferase [bacterium]